MDPRQYGPQIFPDVGREWQEDRSDGDEIDGDDGPPGRGRASEGSGRAGAQVTRRPDTPPAKEGTDR